MNTAHSLLYGRGSPWQTEWYSYSWFHGILYSIVPILPPPPIDTATEAGGMHSCCSLQVCPCASQDSFCSILATTNDSVKKSCNNKVEDWTMITTPLQAAVWGIGRGAGGTHRAWRRREVQDATGRDTDERPSHRANAARALRKKVSTVSVILRPSNTNVKFSQISILSGAVHITWQKAAGT